MNKNELRPAFPFTINLTKNIIYCEVCGKQELLPDDYNHTKKPKNYFDNFKIKHKDCIKKW